MFTDFWPSSATLRKRPHLGLLLAASVVVPAVLFAAYAVQARHAAIADLEDRMVRRTAMLAEHAARVFDTYGLMFDSIENMMVHGASAALVNTRTSQMVGQSEFTGSLLVVDPAGRIVGGSVPDAYGLDVADREYFAVASARPGLVVSGRIVGRITGRVQFGLSRRTVDGHVVAAMVRSLYFEKVFATTAGQDGFDGVAALYRADGTQLVRYPRRDAPINLAPGSPGLMREIPKESGVYRVVRPQSGGRERLYAFHQVPDLPVYVTYGVPLAEAMAAWQASVVLGGLLAAAAAGLLAGGVLVAIRRVEEAHRAETVLQQIVTARTAEAVDAIREREAAVRMAERAHNAKAHFLAAASHDLRQPVQALRLFLEVLDARLEGSEHRQILGHASKALKGAEDLLGALLDVSTLDAGMVDAKLGTVALNDVLSGLATEFASQADARGLRFRHVPTSAWVETDPVLLSRLLRNLLTNALRYTESGGVLLGCRRTGGGIRIEIWDTGRGIPADKLDTVFEDFVQLGNPERDRSRGLGLGLAVVRRMAALLGHPVAVRSVVGRGAVFSVCLRRSARPGVPMEGDTTSGPIALTA